MSTRQMQSGAFVSIARACCLIVAVIALAALTHLAYLYTHCESLPPDFIHKKLILQTPPTLPPQAAQKEHVEKILSQPFHFLGRGRQMTAFESEDHHYVIKFFNPRTFVKKKWFFKIGRIRRMLSLKWISRAYFKRSERLMRLSERHQIAFEEMAKEAGLIYVHLNLSTALPLKLSCKDQTGRVHQLPLAFAPFVLQKKSELVFSHLDALLKKGELEKAQERIRQLYALFDSRAHKGFTDRIQTLHNNYGFTDKGVIQIDVGGIRKETSIKENPQPDIERVFSNITRSLTKRYPTLNDTIEESTHSPGS